MSRMRRIRWLAAGALLVVIASSPGCVVLNGGSSGQPDIIGDYRVAYTICASGSSPGCDFAGNTNTLATSATGQGLVGFRVPVGVVPAATATSTGPEALVFSQSPSYAAELERLAPAPSGSRWVGYVSAVADYSTTSGPQSIVLEIFSKLPHGADGGPFASPVGTDLRVGARQVTPSAPATRPVSCGPSLTSIFDDDPGPAVAGAICVDADTHFTDHLRDLGVLAAGARASGQAGTLAVLPYTLRYAGNAVPGADYALTADSALSGATLAVTPGSLLPPADSDSQALVAVGIPAGARPGSYDVTLTARLANGQARAGVGSLTVLAGPSAGGGRPEGGATARLRLRTVLPRGLSAARARRTGITILIGATTPGTARVLLFQSPGATPKATKGVHLRAPGPIRIVLRARLRTGPYRIVIRAGGRTFVRRASLGK